MKQFLFFLIILVPFLSAAQDCDCVSNFNWTKKTFEENDAGFAYVVEEKGAQAYEKHTETYEEKVKDIDDLTECVQTIYEWLTFFRTGHLSLQLLNGQSNQSNVEQSDEEIIKQSECRTLVGDKALFVVWTPILR